MGVSRAPLRTLVAQPKLADGPPAPWRPLPAPPRFTPFTRSLRGPPGWVWRAHPCVGAAGDFLVLATVSVRMGQYRAWLLQDMAGHLRLLARLEDHASHPGLHLHAWCPTALPEAGTASIAAPDLLRGATPRRSMQGKTPDAFFAAACRMFRVDVPLPEVTQGTLL